MLLMRFKEIILKTAIDTKYRMFENNNCLRLVECQPLNPCHIRYICFDDFAQFGRKFYYSSVRFPTEAIQIPTAKRIQQNFSHAHIEM